MKGYERLWRGYLVAVLGIALVTGALKLFGERINSTTVALALLLVVLFVAAGWGSRPAVLSSLLVLRCRANVGPRCSRPAALSPDWGTSQLNNAGPHGLSEILYAFTSGAGNNGSALAGISANTLWYNSAIGAAMLAGRFFVIIPMLAMAGSLARKKFVPPSLGTFPFPSPLFTTLLVSVILIVRALTFFPALSLGPIVEHLLMQARQTF
jgi:hypothetical protein